MSSEGPTRADCKDPQTILGSLEPILWASGLDPRFRNTLHSGKNTAFITEGSISPEASVHMHEIKFHEVTLRIK